MSYHKVSEPFPNEHSCRIRSPSEFQADSFRRIQRNSISIIIGKLNGETKTTTQAFRYPKTKYTVDSAKGHCEQNNGTFEPASGEARENMFERHPQYIKILQMFVQRFGQALGLTKYTQWLQWKGYDDREPYAECFESFNWAKDKIKFWKQDKEAKYYKLEVAFPVRSLNKVKYVGKELIKAFRVALKKTVGKRVSWIHQQALKGCSIVGSGYENNVGELIIKVMNWATCPKGRNIQHLIDTKQVDQNSLEARCYLMQYTPQGKVCRGMELTGVALLPKEVKPGIPLTTIAPLEMLYESILSEVKTLKENTAEKTVSPEEKIILLEENATLQTRVSDLTEELVEAKQSIELGNTKLKGASQEHEKVQREKTKLMKNLSKRTTEIATAKNDLELVRTEFIGKLQDAQEKIERVNVDRAKTEKLLADVEGLTKEMKEEQTKLRETITSLEETNRDQTVKIGGLNEKVVNNLNSIRESQEKRSEADKRLIKEMQERAKVEEQSSVLNEENADLIKKISELSSARADTAKKLYALQKENATFRESDRILKESLKKYRRLRNINIKI